MIFNNDTKINFKKQKNNLNTNSIYELVFKKKRKHINNSKYKYKFNNDFTKILKEEENDLLINSELNSKLNNNTKKHKSLIEVIKEDKKNSIDLENKSKEKEDNLNNKDTKENKEKEKAEKNNGKYLYLDLGDLYSNRITLSPSNKIKEEKNKDNYSNILEEDNKLEGNINNKYNANILRSDILFLKLTFTTSLQ
jgi:hypothetical protein